jgi:hypothetical protein
VYPQWSRKGQELFFETLDNRVMVSTYTVKGDSFVVDKPRVDRSKMHSVEKARAYQVQIRNSRLVVIRNDAYHIAAANADECVVHTLAFLKEQTSLGRSIVPQSPKWPEATWVAFSDVLHVPVIMRSVVLGLFLKVVGKMAKSCCGI